MILIFISQTSCEQTAPMDKRDFFATKNALSKLGIWTLPNRRMCFAGRTINGIVLPKQKGLKEKAMKSLIVWYLPCLELKSSDPTKLSSFQMNNSCFFRRQNELLKIYSKFSAWNIYRLPLNQYPGQKSITCVKKSFRSRIFQNSKCEYKLNKRAFKFSTISISVA